MPSSRTTRSSGPVRISCACRTSLAGTENRISVERKRYDDAIQAYNTYIGQFPNNIFAGFAGFKRNDAYFAASEASREVPKVQFPGAKQ